ncbi:low-affinity Zn(2+) transporter ZRT2 PWA37_004964 [Arxiozyma heterogenica]|uniref:Uncharacterized protein n=1 Tax=Arxiozyma heterogenica TaxID=278026 RepID=A0AAN7WRL7_9SACH|nr:hypothetical protein RI543_004992 [Kazachstania heterogenica]
MSSSLHSLLPRDGSTDSPPLCSTSNSYNGHNGLRILSIFIILISSALGAFFPILSSRYSFIRLPDWCFFIGKFFGSGVIIATAFIHLLQPASEALGDDCLGGTFVEYPWAFGICLMSLFALFLTEIISHYFVSNSFGDNHEHGSGHSHSHTHSHDSDHDNIKETCHLHSDGFFDDELKDEEGDISSHIDSELSTSNIQDMYIKEFKLRNDLEDSPQNSNIVSNSNILKPSPLSKNRYSYEITHQDFSKISIPVEEKNKEEYLNQIVAVTILEAGVLFHSVFVGLSLSVSGEEFETLFIVLTFHQMFEGLGLGTRIAETNWPHSKRATPWLMALAFSLTCPIAVAIGIGVRNSWVPGSRRALIANGVFDSISSGILIYTGLVELMAHEFLFTNQFKGPGGLKRMLAAYIVMSLGAGLMALLGKWA